jgi:hypothetical protein
LLFRQHLYEWWRITFIAWLCSHGFPLWILFCSYHHHHHYHFIIIFYCHGCTFVVSRTRKWRLLANNKKDAFYWYVFCLFDSLFVDLLKAKFEIVCFCKNFNPIDNCGSSFFVNSFTLNRLFCAHSVVVSLLISELFHTIIAPQGNTINLPKCSQAMRSFNSKFGSTNFRRYFRLNIGVSVCMQIMSRGRTVYYYGKSMP